MPNSIQIFTSRVAPAAGTVREGDMWLDPTTQTHWFWQGGTAGGLRRILLSAAAALGIGYRTGAGGTVTQATNKTTGVTLSRPSGQITMNGAALAAGAEATFTVTNTVVEAPDVIIVNHGSAGTSGAYLVGVGAVAAGSFDIVVSNVSGGSLSEAIVLNFAVIKGASA